MKAWRARHAFISYARPDQINLAAELCQSFALDNGAFSFWNSGIVVTDWAEYYDFVRKWRRHPGFDFAVVPDVIGGSEAENDQLAEQWPLPRHEAAVVWHLNESPERLVRLASEWPRIALGSCAEFDVSKPEQCLGRLRDVLPLICDDAGRPICKLHGLRMLNPAVFTMLPLASADSTNVARNIGIDQAWRGTYQPASKETRTIIMVERIEQFNSAGHMIVPANSNIREQFDLFA